MTNLQVIDAFVNHKNKKGRHIYALGSKLINYSTTIARYDLKLDVFHVSYKNYSTTTTKNIKLLIQTLSYNYNKSFIIHPHVETLHNNPQDYEEWFDYQIKVHKMNKFDKRKQSTRYFTKNKIRNDYNIMYENYVKYCNYYGFKVKTKYTNIYKNNTSKNTQIDYIRAEKLKIYKNLLNTDVRYFIGELFKDNSLVDDYISTIKSEESIYNKHKAYDLLDLYIRNSIKHKYGYKVLEDVYTYITCFIACLVFDEDINKFGKNKDIITYPSMYLAHYYNHECITNTMVLHYSQICNDMHIIQDYLDNKSVIHENFCGYKVIHEDDLYIGIGCHNILRKNVEQFVKKFKEVEHD